jgi:hypothetical protein
MVAYYVSQLLGRQWQEDCEFEAILGKGSEIFCQKQN